MTQGQPDTAAAQRLARAQLGARLALTALLLVLAAAGIRAVGPVITRGPLHQDGTAVAAGLEVVLATLLAVVSRRRQQLDERQDRLPYLLNSILVPVLRASVIVLPVSVLFSLLHVIHGTPRKLKPGAKIRLAKGEPANSSGWREIVMVAERAALFVVLIAALIAALACLLLIVRWRRAARVSCPAVPDEDFPGRLRQAVQAGRRALAGLDEARAAIIACYVAMEQSLASAGAVRSVAETPDELLARAVSAGLVRGGAAGRLTALFYQARFSARPLPDGSLAAARQALAELAASPARGTAVTAR